MTTTVTQWARELAEGESGRRGLAAASFLESTVVPLPLEALVAPLMAAHPERAWQIAWAIFLGCLAGALSFYFVALWLFDPVVAPVLDWLGLKEAFADARADMTDRGLFWTVFLVSITPVPFQLATLGAGASGGSVFVFMSAVAVSRAIRYFGLAFLARRFGPQLMERFGGRRRFLVGSVALLAALWLIAQLIGGA